MQNNMRGEGGVPAECLGHNQRDLGGAMQECRSKYVVRGGCLQSAWGEPPSYAPLPGSKEV